ncbi:hypothetical protein scyTo_0020611, partial [Scyliorhinus torazame]|nr:hypothetical protein [Scyliorhinus torazame]
GIEGNKGLPWLQAKKSGLSSAPTSVRFASKI